MNCPAHLADGPLECVRTDNHATGHVYHADWAPDSHTDEVNEAVA